MHLDLDGAWGDDVLGLGRVDARPWGPRVRCYVPRAFAESLYTEVLAPLPPFVLYGSGDYHLAPASPAIQSGTSAGAPATDIAGSTRSGSSFDVGAYGWNLVPATWPFN